MLEFFKLLGSVALPTSDAWLDWRVTYQFYRDGDVHWFEAGLAINLISGALFGLPLVAFALSGDMQCWKKLPLALLSLLIGISGLAPAFAGLFALVSGDVKEGTKMILFIKAVELIFEALPQSILQ